VITYVRMCFPYAYIDILLFYGTGQALSAEAGPVRVYAYVCVFIFVCTRLYALVRTHVRVYQFWTVTIAILAEA